jgi:tRNA pseudouridine32 synthase / 23S rRNA pseudouridine746 synthase
MINIVFENADFIICDKPGEVLSVPDRLGTASNRKCLGIELEKTKSIKIYPAHRLDFEVSGLILYAKNSSAHKASQDWFEKKKIHKLYRGLSLSQNFDHVKKWPEKNRQGFIAKNFVPELDQQLVWKSQIMRGKKRAYHSPNGEWAETHVKLVGREKNMLLWDLSPITGKSHQLRFEMSQHGFPLLGDRLYGSESSLDEVPWPHRGIGLRAIELDLSHINDRLGLPEKVFSQNSL